MTCVRQRMRRIALALAGSLALATPAIAMQDIDFATKMEVEKTTTSAEGQITTNYTSSEVVVPGDRIRFSLILSNNGSTPADALKFVNPLAAEMRFEGTPDMAGFAVSTDDGKTFGALETLTVPVGGDAPRAATNDDATHLQWKLAEALPAGGTKTVTFFASVR